MSSSVSWPSIIATLILLVIVSFVWYIAKRNAYKKAKNKVCPLCGEKLAPDAKFCRICGTKNESH
jgi:ribosomal protein L40E